MAITTISNVGKDWFINPAFNVLVALNSAISIQIQLTSVGDQSAQQLVSGNDPSGLVTDVPIWSKMTTAARCLARQRVRPRGHSLLMANTVTAALAQWRFAAFTSPALCCWTHLCSEFYVHINAPCVFVSAFPDSGRAVSRIPLHGVEEPGL